MDLHEVAAIIAGAGGGSDLRLRLGTVTAVAGDGTFSATIAGSTAAVSGIRAFASVTPEVGKGIWLAIQGSDVFGVGAIGSPAVPAGIVEIWAGPLAAIPGGWLLCDGSAVSRTAYGALFAAIGTTFGAGDGSTTFNLPDSRDRFPVGAGSSYALGAKGGEATHVLTQAEIPSHVHSVSAISATAGSTTTYGSGNRQASIQTGSIGGDGAHNNLPPYLAFPLIIRT